MAKFLLLAFRNVFRNRRRTVMTLLMVGGGVAGLLLVGGFFAFMFRGLRESTIRTGLGHIQIFNAEHFRRDEVHVLDTGISNWQQVAAATQSARHVRGVAPRIEFYGMFQVSQRARQIAPVQRGHTALVRFRCRRTVALRLGERQVGRCNPQNRQGGQQQKNANQN